MILQNLEKQVVHTRCLLFARNIVRLSALKINNPGFYFNKRSQSKVALDNYHK